MAVRKPTGKITTPQPVGGALGLLAGCLVVGLGGWVGLRPETILVRALIVGGVTAVAVRIVTAVFNTVFSEKDE